MFSFISWSRDRSLSFHPKWFLDFWIASNHDSWSTNRLLSRQIVDGTIKKVFNVSFKGDVGKEKEGKRMAVERKIILRQDPVEWTKIILCPLPSISRCESHHAICGRRKEKISWKDDSLIWRNTDKVSYNHLKFWQHQKRCPWIWKEEMEILFPVHNLLDLFDPIPYNSLAQPGGHRFIQVHCQNRFRWLFDVNGKQCRNNHTFLVRYLLARYHDFQVS